MYNSNNIKSQNPFSTTLRESNPGNHITVYVMTIIVRSWSCEYGYNTERPVTVDMAIRIDFIPAGAALLLPNTLDYLCPDTLVWVMPDIKAIDTP